MKKNIALYLRALRIEFAPCCLLPFLCGSVLARDVFSVYSFILGFIAVLGASLSANLINDYADSKSGVDWHDTIYHKYFGGSKLIQQNILSEDFYKKGAIICALGAVFAALYLSVTLHRVGIVLITVVCITAGWVYSMKPIALSYRRWGEVTIFILFSLMPVCFGYYIQTGVVCALRPVFISLPFGFLVTAVLFVNEIPDFVEDIKSGKHTWVSMTGPERAFYIYGVLQCGALISIIGAVINGYLHHGTLVALIVILIVASKSIMVLKKFPRNKARLIRASRLTIIEHGVVGIILIIGSTI